jgi:cyclophilin family peptidyl-prolyl cis-trans isomerase
MGKKKIKKQEARPVNRTIIYAIVVFCVALLATVGYGAYQQEVAGKRAAQTAAETAAKTAAGTDKQEQPAAGQTKPGDNEKTTGTLEEDNVTDANAATETERVIMTTSKGEIELELYPKLMPITVANFEKLISAKFYDGLTFHRVEDWVIQGGDPQGNGTGGPGWNIKLETNPQLKNVRGALAMARSREPDSAGSQFYILKTDASWLDGQYAVFGKVTKGLEVVDRIAIGDKMQEVKLVK